MARKRTIGLGRSGNKRRKSAGQESSTGQLRESEQPLKSAQQEAIPILNFRDINAQAFWSEYISHRKPVLIRGQADWDIGHWQTDYLQSKAV